jgi:hypothetical protein
VSLLLLLLHLQNTVVPLLKAQRIGGSHQGFGTPDIYRRRVEPGNFFSLIERKVCLGVFPETNGTRSVYHHHFPTLSELLLRKGTKKPFPELRAIPRCYYAVNDGEKMYQMKMLESPGAY